MQIISAGKVIAKGDLVHFRTKGSALNVVRYIRSREPSGFSIQLPDNVLMAIIA